MVNAKHVVNEREGTLIRLTSEDGVVGWGEATPFPGFGLESATEAREALANVSSKLLKSEFELDASASGHLFREMAHAPTAQSASEFALLSLLAAASDQTLREFLAETPPGEIDSIPCNALVSGVELADLEASARAGMKEGFRTFKLKVGTADLERDVSRVKRLREIVGSQARIRLDANQAFAIDSARRAIERFAPYAIEYLEQPLPARDLDGMSVLRNESTIALAADEAATTEAAAKRVIDAGAADVIVIKPSAAGGPLASLRIARLAREAGLEIVVTSLLDGVVAVSSALQVAAVLQGEGQLGACGLATGGVFLRDVAGVVPIADGRMPLNSSSGLGIEIKESDVRACLSGSVVELRA